MEIADDGRGLLPNRPAGVDLTLSASTCLSSAGVMHSYGRTNVFLHGQPIVKRVALADLLREFGRL